MKHLVVAFAMVTAACASTPTPPPRPHAAQPTHDAATELNRTVAASRYTVVLFFSRHCPCVQKHEPRLFELFAKYSPAGVRFIALDPEIDSSPTIDAAEHASRRYPFPLVHDTGARLAREYGAEYASYVVVLDRNKRVLYRGGIDSDRVHLRDDATPFLAAALSDVTSGAPVRTPEARSLGCTLRTN